MNTDHLTQNDLMKAMISRGDLTDETAAHLSSCPTCKRNLEQITLRYRRLGRLAARLTPKPTRSVRIPTGVSMASNRKTRSLWAIGLTAAVILLLTVYGPHPFVKGPSAPSESPLLSQTTQTSLSDQQLLWEVDALIEDALPQSIQQMAAVDIPQFDDDVINWVVPFIEDMEDVL